MTKRIAVAGKGGVGKTTFCALIIRQLLKHNLKPILAVDADPNSNLGDLLNIKYDTTIADIRDTIKENKNLPPNMAKSDYVDMKLNEIISEGEGIDFIAMGRPEGKECYCYINELLRGFLSRITKQYAVTIVDNEAGMEHLSRRTTDNVDALFIVTDPTVVSINSAKKVHETAKGLKLKIEKTYLVLNRAKKNADAASILKSAPIELIGTLPYEETIISKSENGEPLSGLSETDPYLLELEKILKNSGIV
ncbi:MAG: AAA family ATPase [Elusimicrobia bacterium]|nr:AAA family ATPase [Elusimicrobiota bacterium]